MTFDYEVVVSFNQASRASSRDTNQIEGTIQYIGKI